MEKLAGLQHLVNAPKLSVANKIINLVFERRSTGFTEEEESQISKILGGLSPEDTESLLVAIRLLIKISLRKNIELTQIPQAFPDSVDKRLHPIILKILSAHVDTWRQEIAQDRAQAAAPEQPPEQPSETTPKKKKQHPKPEEPSLPPPEIVESTPSEAPESVPEPAPTKEDVSPSLPPPPPPAAPEEEEEEEEEEEKEAEKVLPPPPAVSSLPPAPSKSEPEKEAEMKAEAERINRLKKKKRAAQQQQQQQRQQLQQLSGPSLPRLQGFDWRIDVRSASDSVARMAVPSVIVQMDVQKQRMGKQNVGDEKEGGENGNSRVVTFELNRETLETMLDGLIFVRDQLASIASK